MIKIKTIEHDSEKLAKFIEWTGVIFMSAAALSGLAELPDYINNHISQIRPEFAWVNAVPNINNDPMLREKDDSTPHYMTYNINRTVSRSGRR